MHLEALLAWLVHAALCIGIAFLAALLLRSRHGILGYAGAGLLGEGLGGWLASLLSAGSWPGRVDVAGTSVHLLWTFVGALLILLLFRAAPRAKAWAGRRG